MYMWTYFYDMSFFDESRCFILVVHISCAKEISRACLKFKSIEENKTRRGGIIRRS